MESTDSIKVPNDILLAEVGKMLDAGREVILLARGSSMLPFIRGDRDSVRLTRCEAVRERDVVLAQVAPGQYVIHRVVAMRDGKLVLRGDGNMRGTETCSPVDVLGKVRAVVGPDGKERPVRDGKVWERLGPLKRYFLAVYRRMI